MKQVSYSRTMTVTATPDEAYAAVSRDIRKWWSEIGAFEKAGDVATVTFPPNRTSWTFRAKTLKPGELVELECIDANHIHDGAPESLRTEWQGTTLVWRIERESDVTNVQFTHDGLRPGLACYDVCVAGWEHFIGSSLQAYLDTGIGRPGHKDS